jgi:hypothetical protein
MGPKRSYTWNQKGFFYGDSRRIPQLMFSGRTGFFKTFIFAPPLFPSLATLAPWCLNSAQLFASALPLMLMWGEGVLATPHRSLVSRLRYGLLRCYWDHRPRDSTIVIMHASVRDERYNYGVRLHPFETSARNVPLCIPLGAPLVQSRLALSHSVLTSADDGQSFVPSKLFLLINTCQRSWELSLSHTIFYKIYCICIGHVCLFRLKYLVCDALYSSVLL